MTRPVKKLDTVDMVIDQPADLSFEEVAKVLSAPLGRYLQRLVTDRNIAEDLLQETLIRIARGLPDFEGLSSVKTWAYTIATNTATDHFRKNGASPLVLEESEAAEWPDDTPTPEQRLALDQMNTCVREVVADLPEEYRAAILLHDFGGLSARETATACGCSEASAKIRIHRARAKLKTALQKECAIYHDEDNVLRCHRRD
ncbi:MAG: RNA polymerase sigma factor [Sideroxyarcus sp.]|nr:RNA polymerase sigma factor [Sideroxyarcus sp.]